MGDAINIVGRSSERESVSQGVVRSLVGTPDGALHTADYVLGKALEGRLFHAAVGSLTTPTTFRVGADADQPEAVIDVPTGTTIVPVSIQAYLEDAAGTDNEIVAQANPAVVGAGTSTTGTIYSARLNSGESSRCTFRYTYSGNGTAPSSYIEFYRDGNAFANEADTRGLKFAWSIQQAAPVVLVGPAALVIYIDGTGTAPAGYLQLAFMEFSSALI